MKKSLIIILLCFAFTANAQIKGNITDKEGMPLSSVSVYLEKTITGTTSNDNGDYVLNIKKTGNYTIVFQILGYKTLKKNVVIASLPYQLNVLDGRKRAVNSYFYFNKRQPCKCYY